MTLTQTITTLQRISLGYTIRPLATDVGIRVDLDTDLFDRDHVDERGRDFADALERGLTAAMAIRNDRPRLVSITVIAGLDREVVTS